MPEKTYTINMTNDDSFVNISQHIPKDASKITIIPDWPTFDSRATMSDYDSGQSSYNFLYYIPFIFETFKKLKHLKIQGTPLTGEAHIEFINMIPDQVTHLDLSNQNLNRVDTTNTLINQGRLFYYPLKYSYDITQNLTNLTYLNLENNYICKKNIAFITNKLGKLTYLNLRQNIVCSKTVKLISVNLRNLEYLNLNNSYAIKEEDGYEYIKDFDIELLTKNLSNLKYFYFNNDTPQPYLHTITETPNTDVTDSPNILFFKKTVHFFFGFKKKWALWNIKRRQQQNLKILEEYNRYETNYVDDNHITFKSVESIANNLPNLTHLDLSNRNFGGREIKLISNKLKKLQFLDFSDNRINSNDLEYLIDNLTQLHTLKLKGNDLNDIPENMLDDFESLKKYLHVEATDSKKAT